MKLTKPTDKELNEAFAKHVAKLTKKSFETRDHSWWVNSAGLEVALPDFIVDISAVLPYLEKGSFYCKRNYFMASNETPDRYFVHFCRWCALEREQCESTAYAETFSKAAVVALLIAHGVQVTFK